MFFSNLTLSAAKKINLELQEGNHATFFSLVLLAFIEIA